MKSDCTYWPRKEGNTGRDNFAKDQEAPGETLAAPTR